jgi:putative lipase involved disintegration of autophagic bodies
MASEGPHKVPLQLLLEGGALEWLLGRDAAASLVVLEARGDLPADAVLQLLQGGCSCHAGVVWHHCARTPPLSTYGDCAHPPPLCTYRGCKESAETVWRLLMMELMVWLRRRLA